jgi:hypothetical protein
MMKRRNSINARFAARTVEMLESPAYRVLSRAGHMIMSRIEIELGAHAGNDADRLPVTNSDFEDYGLHREAIAPGIREVEALGFIKITERGRGGNAEHRAPNMFFLTYAVHRGKEPLTNDWRRIKTIEEAHTIAQRARANKNPRAVAHGKAVARKIIPDPGFRHVSTPDSGGENDEVPTPVPGVQGLLGIRGYYLYLGVGEPSASVYLVWNRPKAIQQAAARNFA